MLAFVLSLVFFTVWDRVGGLGDMRRDVDVFSDIKIVFVLKWSEEGGGMMVSNIYTYIYIYIYTQTALFSFSFIVFFLVVVYTNGGIYLI